MRFYGAGIDACGDRYAVRPKSIRTVGGADARQELADKIEDGDKKKREAEEVDEQGRQEEGARPEVAE